LAYQLPASSTFLSEQISHQQPVSSTFLSEQISTSHQPNEHTASLLVPNHKSIDFSKFDHLPALFKKLYTIKFDLFIVACFNSKKF
jgi:hypothetical protein